MIELNIKIKAKDEETFMMFVTMMTQSIEIANNKGISEISLYAEREESKITISRTIITDK